MFVLVVKLTLIFWKTAELFFVDYSHCFSSPCSNGGNCHAELNSYVCQCPPGFTGTDCETSINISRVMI